MQYITTTVLSLIMVLSFLSPQALAQPSSFTYQGSLTDSGGLADGIYDFEFNLFAAATGGASLGISTSSTVDVVGGIFSVQLDFGSAVFDGSNRYLEISIRFNGGPGFTTLTPRVPIDSVPYATFASSAGSASWATDGPFAPFDRTPTSTSGTGPAGAQTISVTLTIDGQQFTNVEVQYPITITREVVNNSFGIVPQDYNDFRLIVSKPFDSNAPWSDFYQPRATPVTVQIRTSNFTPGDVTLFTFQTGAVTGHRLDQDEAQGLRDVLTISFGALALPNQTPLSNIFIRDASGFSKNTPPPYSPYLGGSAILPDLYTYSFGNFTPPHSSIATLPDESTPTAGGFPNGLSQSQPLVMLHNVFADRFNTMWDSFATNSYPSSTIELRDANGVIWQPPYNPSGGGVISAWTLDIADDGGLYETYELQYLAEPQFP